MRMHRLATLKKEEKMNYGLSPSYSLYSTFSVSKPFTTIIEQTYVPDSTYCPEEVLYHRRYRPSHLDFSDDEDYDYYDDEEYDDDYEYEDDEVEEEVEDDSVKEEDDSNNLHEVTTEESEMVVEEAPRKKMTLFQIAVVIILVLRLGRKRSQRMKEKHEARKALLKYLDVVNSKIKEDDKKMKEKLSKLEEQIRKEESEMEKKWEEKKAKTIEKTSKSQKGEELSIIGPHYNKEQNRIDKKMTDLDIEYEKDKCAKKVKWNNMKKKYHKELENLQSKQDKRKLKKCHKIYEFEKKWNQGPKTVKEYIKQREEQIKNTTNAQEEKTENSEK
ncbi:hypothetical protein POVWA2_023970 [Plasmodium ovale wallikeri]|uniref:Uncharacterized protein n=2 Tax=Plasmodium ovale TaxID=36330 RepID=A0A1A8YTE6_PLAOA|nr:hypothetical protein POVWA1_024080 [Plasmodium ovale wallikeri]SBT35220.1 hypothetical protein POVWA2_023970 [Plasmodium ovale wallikeri]